MHSSAFWDSLWLASETDSSISFPKYAHGIDQFCWIFFFFIVEIICEHYWQVSNQSVCRGPEEGPTMLCLEPLPKVDDEPQWLTSVGWERRTLMYSDAFLLILRAFAENWQPVGRRFARESDWFIVLRDRQPWKRRSIWSGNKEQREFGRNSCCFWFLLQKVPALLVFRPGEQSEQIGLILNEPLAVFARVFFFLLFFYFLFFVLLNRFRHLLMTLLFEIMLMPLCLSL